MEHKHGVKSILLTVSVGIVGENTTCQQNLQRYADSDASFIRAEKFYTDCKKPNPDTVRGCHQWLAWSLFIQKRYADALGTAKEIYARRSLEKSPGATAGMAGDVYLEGRCDLALGQFAAAEECIKKSIELQTGAKSNVDDEMFFLASAYAAQKKIYRGH